MDNLRKAKGILAYFSNWNLDKDAETYLQFHCRRYELLLKKVDEIILQAQKEPLKILDIGPAFQTEILRKALPQATIDTLGFENSISQPRLKDKHFQFDLNNIYDQKKWPKIEKYDLIIMAEVIEHLPLSPILVFRFLSSFLKNGGYLIIQTPNACAFDKRLIMLLGRNPYEMIRETKFNPGHFREYTIKELIFVGEKTEFKPIKYNICNYFNNGTARHKFYNILSAIFPPKLRHGITIIFKNEKQI